MRVTQSMLSNNMLKNLSNNYGRLSKLQDQISSEKKFSKPSDDPVAAMLGMGYRTDLNQIEQFQSNIGEARNWVESTDDALDSAIQALQKIRELTVEGSNDTLVDSEKKAIAEQINQLKEQIVTLGDSKVGGKYIFNGTKTNESPVGSSFADATGEIKIEVFSGIKIQVNTPGQDLFEDYMKSDGDIQQLINTLNDPNSSPDTIDSYLGKIDSQLDKFLSAQAKVGAKQNRIDLMEDRLTQQETFSTQILSDNEDLDVEKAIIEFTTQESVYRAALSVGSKIIQPSLLDFLR